MKVSHTLKTDSELGMNGESQFPIAKRLIGELGEGQTSFVSFLRSLVCQRALVH